MREDFLHYVWRFKKLNNTSLKTIQNNNLVIKDFGLYLGVEGPDFFNAQIYLDEQLWAGTIEMHVNASDWYVHHHEMDPAYDNVILHVVWNNDLSVLRKNGTEIPTLILKDYIPDNVFEAYYLFKKNPKYLFCEDSIDQFNSFDWLLWKEKLMIERLEQFTTRIVHELQKTNNNWEESFYRLLLKSFGLNINGEAFYEISNKLPLNIIRKEQTNLMHLEALFIGTANLLVSESEDFYYNTLRKTYNYLQQKYNLQQLVKAPSFYKSRPDNFPTIRLVQFASFIHHQPFLFDLIRNPESISSNNHLLGAKVSDYWKTHYVFGKEHGSKSKFVSQTFYELLLINTILPFQYVYHQQVGSDVIEEVLQHYQSINTEKNSTTEMFKKLLVPVKSSLDSQSLLFLKKNYCDLKRCLNCEIGIKLMNR